MGVNELTGGTSAYWYSGDGVDASAVDVLNLMRRYREAESTMRSHMRGEMGMRENDLLSLRFLLEARAKGIVVRQKDLAHRLDITTASASNLVDRLVRDGYARRTSHPDDRRSVAVEATEHGHREMRETLSHMHERMYGVVAGMRPEDRSVVASFLERMIDSVYHEAGDTEPQVSEPEVSEPRAAEHGDPREG